MLCLELCRSKVFLLYSCCKGLLTLLGNCLRIFSGVLCVHSLLMSSQFNLLLFGCFILGLDLCRNRVLSLHSFLPTHQLLVLNLSTLIQTVCIIFISLDTLLELLFLNLRIYLLSCLLLCILTIYGLLMRLCLSLGDLLSDRQSSLYPVLTFLLLIQSLLVNPTLFLNPSLIILKSTLKHYESKIRLGYQKRKQLTYQLPLFLTLPLLV